MRAHRALNEGGADEEFFAILCWANPGLSGLPDPYGQGITVEQVGEAAEAAVKPNQATVDSRP